MVEPGVIGAGQAEVPSDLTDVVLNPDVLEQKDLDRLAAAATEIWKGTGLTEEQQQALQLVTYEIADLTGGSLATSQGTTLTFDIDAGGRSWFIDETLSHQS